MSWNFLKICLCSWMPEPWVEGHFTSFEMSCFDQGHSCSQSQHQNSNAGVTGSHPSQDSCFFEQDDSHFCHMFGFSMKDVCDCQVKIWKKDGSFPQQTTTRWVSWWWWLVSETVEWKINNVQKRSLLILGASVVFEFLHNSFSIVLCSFVSHFIMKKMCENSRKWVLGAVFPPKSDLHALKQFTMSKNMWTEDDAISFSFFTKVCVDACKGLFSTRADEGNCWRWVESGVGNVRSQRW